MSSPPQIGEHGENPPVPVVGGEPEPGEDPLTCLITADSLSTRVRAISALVRPRAISASIARSRSLGRLTGSRADRPANTLRTTRGSMTVRPAATSVKFLPATIVGSLLWTTSMTGVGLVIGPLTGGDPLLSLLAGVVSATLIGGILEGTRRIIPRREG